MKFYHLLSILFICLLAYPAHAVIPDRYFPPTNIASSLKIKSSTNSTVTFWLEVKSLLGTIRNLRLSARLSGFDQVVPIPSETKFEEVKEGESRYLDFVLPTTKEIANSNLFKIRGIIGYIPDYDAALKYVEDNAECQYPNEPMRNTLIYDLTRWGDQSLESVESIRYFPPKN